MAVEILIGGDVSPTPSSFSAFSAGEITALLADGLAERWLSADCRAFNLETPLTDQCAPIQKCGPCLAAPIACAAGIAALKPDAVGLANNHIFDHGETGLFATLAALDAYGITHFGAGNNRAEADLVSILSVNELRIGFFAVCETEFSLASETAAGANPIDPLTLLDRVRAAKAACDRLIVLYHGGREHYPYPSPTLARTCRAVAGAGADLVLCQHSHCIGCHETYAGCEIVYGQGNFLFDANDAHESFSSGLLVSAVFDGDGTQIDFLPVTRSVHGARLLAGTDARAVLDPFFARSAEITQNGFIEDAYARCAADAREKLLHVFLGGNPLLRAVNRLYGRKPSRAYGSKHLLAIRNTLACESIRELLTKGLS